MLTFLLVMVTTFVTMEFVSYLVHRFVYHGFLWIIHRSHHSKREGPFELNDLFPVMFAAITIPMIVAGVSNPDGLVMIAVGVGMTLYGAVYFFIHDLYVHRRVKTIRIRLPFLMTLKKAHAVHHRRGGEPYGLLFFLSLRTLASVTVAEDEQV